MPLTLWVRLHGDHADTFQRAHKVTEHHRGKVAQGSLARELIVRGMRSMHSACVCCETMTELADLDADLLCGSCRR